MATKKYLSLDGLTEYDALIKTEIDTIASNTLESAKQNDITIEDNCKTYTDEVVAQKAQVQIITWGADD